MKRWIQTKIFEHFDWPLLLCVMVILVLGLLNLYSATYDLPEEKYFRKQSFWIGIGIFVALLTLFLDYRYLERFAYLIYLAGVLLLVAVLFIGKTSQGAQRWLEVGPVLIQPSEIMKVMMAIGLAKFLHDRRSSQYLDFKDLIFPFVLTIIPFVLILKEPDLGTALIVGSVSFSMILFAGVTKRVLISIFLVLVIAIPASWTFVLKPYQKDRVYTFLNPEKDALGKGYQVVQSKIAIGSGELSGRGYKKGTQSKLKFLPKQHTDFIFSNYAEEFGFLGSFFFLLLYASFSLLALNVAFAAKDRFGMMLAIGLLAMILWQAVINLGMEMGALPVVGMTLPLLSYGGTSMVTTLVAVGLLLNISMRRYIF